VNDQLRADVVIVGGGTAGCVLAARLSEDPARSVLLLEAGPVSLPLPDALLDARRVPGAVGEASWSIPGRLASGRPYAFSRGRVIGGSSTTNGGYFLHAPRADFEEWSVNAGSAWSWEAVRPRQLALEAGHGGPVPVETLPADDPVIAALPGAMPTPSNRRGRTRMNAALTHLTPALGRPNLRIVGGVEADAALIRSLDAGEIVFAAGSLRTPRLLRDLGIGGAGVGEGLDDHPQLILEVEGWPELSPDAPTWLGGVVHAVLSDGSTAEVLQGFLPGPLCFVSTRGERGRLGDGVEFDHLATAAARARLREAVRLAVGLVEGDGRARVTNVDRGTLARDSSLDAWIAAHLGTSQHACGGAAIGDVVDGAGRVIGAERYRVADTSILPSAPRRGPAATAFLIGELIAAAF